MAFKFGELLCPRPHRAETLSLHVLSGLSQEQVCLGRLKLAQVAYVTRDSDTTFKVKRLKVNLLGRGGGILWRPPAQLVRCQFHCSFSIICIQFS